MNHQPLTTNNIEQLLKLALDAYNRIFIKKPVNLPSLSGYKIGIVWVSKPDTNIYK